AAVGAVVVGEQQAGLAGIADQLEERAQALRVLEVGNTVLVALACERGQWRRRVLRGLRMALRQDRTAQPLASATQPDQPQLALALAFEQRRQLATDVAYGGERGDDEGHR